MALGLGCSRVPGDGLADAREGIGLPKKITPDEPGTELSAVICGGDGSDSIAQVSRS